MSERVCAFTCVDDRGFESRGARKLASSFKHFHGDIDFYVFGDRIVNEVFRQNGRGWYDSKPSFAKRLADRYDLVIHFDADCLVLAPLDELLTTHYDIGATLNHNWFQPAALCSITNHMYVGASTFACRSKRFLDNWEHANRFAMTTPEWPETPWREQGCFNIVYHYGDYKTRSFGVHGDGTDLTFGRGFYGSQSLNRWGDCVMANGYVTLDGKRVITLHEGGGYGRSGEPGSPRLDYRAHFKADVADYIDILARRKVTLGDDGLVLKCE